jgi:hypothetical protein
VGFGGRVDKSGSRFALGLREEVAQGKHGAESALEEICGRLLGGFCERTPFFLRIGKRLISSLPRYLARKPKVPKGAKESGKAPRVLSRSSKDNFLVTSVRERLSSHAFTSATPDNFPAIVLRADRFP